MVNWLCWNGRERLEEEGHELLVQVRELTAILLPFNGDKVTSCGLHLQQTLSPQQPVVISDLWAHGQAAYC